ncbi:hypothetical protein J7481_22855 [Labrenzia sp. R4_2]|uniref:hypothetical protein n=1 Tax=Labrenzia sp. R4_2 TaxID=2821107 RepID=UPI001AD99376|nr:hypothetical protein [Labrenzia sp. R4_2]MBO9422369.1 hypothetical protein [Labrenzia sp. R4_2]
MSKLETKNDVAGISDSISTLRQRCQIWEAGLYRSSNEELYSILEQCHLFLESLRTASQMRKAFSKALTSLGIDVRSDTSLELKVVKAIFGKENTRVHAYVRLLRIAKTDLPKGKTLSDWIVEQGGVEEIRRKPKIGPTAAEIAKQRREVAEQRLYDVETIGTRFDPEDSLKPDPDGDYPFSVALVRVDSDCKAGVVFGSNKTTLIAAVLAEAGARLEDTADQQEVVSKHTEKRIKRDQVLSRADVPSINMPALIISDAANA